nr:L-histidine N(alpha)-methyltransferase [Lusitaniella coriacea]
MSTFSSTTQGHSSCSNERLHIEYVNASSHLTATNDAEAVIEGLTRSRSRKTLPPQFFYDDKGSQLFEKICTLPEYYPTRTEAWILQTYASEIVQKMGECELVELGSGSSTKTRLLLDACARQNYPLRYLPIDVSGGILQESAKQLLQDYPTLKVYGLVGTYEQALAKLPPVSLPHRAICFLGSTLGNFYPEECDRLLDRMAATLNKGDFVLLGLDLDKSPTILEPAYNDSQGVTAAFNRNMLSHLNWRFGGNFDPDLFDYEGRYNPEKSQMEMYLTARQSHQVRLEKLDLTVEFSPGEAILTEISRKFNVDRMENYLRDRGLSLIQTWHDPQKWFGLLLSQVL